MTDTYELPWPTAWAEAYVIKALTAAGARASYSFSDARLYTFDAGEGELRTSLFTADQVRAAIRKERERCARIVDLQFAANNIPLLGEIAAAIRKGVPS